MSTGHTLRKQSSGKQDIIGRTDTDLYPEPLAEINRLDDRKAMESAAPVHNIRSLMVKGEHRLFNTVKFPMHATDGHIVGVCGIAIDITDTLWGEEEREAEHRRDISAKPFERLFATLTPQEARVAELLSLDYSDREIAESLYVAPDTVRHHISHVLKKLRKQSRTQAVIEILGHRRSS